VARLARTISTVRGSASRGSGARLAITFFVLFAFTLQTYVLQTHIHGTAGFGVATAKLVLDKNAAQKQRPDKLPPANDPANCPICQEILHTGFYVTPSAAVLPPPAVAVSIAPTVIDIVTAVEAHSHIWKSRAPPFA
jgi:hypothetical protein